MQKKAFGISGLSGSGKTHLTTRLIAWLGEQGYKVSTIKHTHHSVDLDSPGKDTWQMREAGACEVFLVSSSRSVLMHEYRDEAEPTLDELIARLAPCHLVLVEGFKRDPLPKIEVFRPHLDTPPIWPQNPAVVAIASDEAIETPLPVLDLNNTEAIARFILNHVDITQD